MTASFDCLIIFSVQSYSASSCLGDRAFAAAGPQLWNRLPVHIRQPVLTLCSFYQKLIPETADVFLSWRHQHLVTVFMHCVWIIVTYLLTISFDGEFLF